MGDSAVVREIGFFRPPAAAVENGSTVKTELDPVRERTDVKLDEERAKTDIALHAAATGVENVEEEFSFERSQTDARLQRERDKTDEVIDDASALLSEEQVANARSKTDVAGRDQFLAFVSHELRSPLTAIDLNTQSLLALSPAALGEPTTKETLEDIRASCAQMARLVSDLLDVASMEAGRLKVTLARGDALLVMHAAIAASAPMLQKQGLFLTVHEPRHPLLARFDHSRLLQVFANLFANAVKFTLPGGTITVTVAEIASTLRFCVTDTGCGIPPKALFQVFDRFWQRGKGDRRGLGLGLYLCKAIVEAHGGKIWVSSEEGLGTSFFFTVPAALGAVPASGLA